MFRELREIIRHSDGTVSYLCRSNGDWVGPVTAVPIEHLRDMSRLAQVAIVKHLGMDVDLDALCRAPETPTEPRPEPEPRPLELDQLLRFSAPGRPKRTSWPRRKRKSNTSL